MSSSPFQSQCGSGSSRADSFCTVDLRHEPLYPFTGHPLVYYAQLPESYSSRLRGRVKKDNPNCFVKAFRWYTQEHTVPISPANDGRAPHTAEFASWLDRRYGQFLCDGQERSAAAHRRVASSHRVITNKPCRSRTDNYKRCNQSLEIILHAKDLSRPASECCFQNKRESCCDSPRFTVASSDTEIMNKNSKVQNYAAIVQDEAHVRILEETVTKVTKLDDDDSKVKTETLYSASGLSKNKNYKSNERNVHCQCPEEYVGRTETGTQYDLNGLKNEVQCNTSFAPVVKTKERSNTQQSSSKAVLLCECLNKRVKIDCGTQYYQPEAIKSLEQDNIEIKSICSQGIINGSALLQQSQVKSIERADPHPSLSCRCTLAEFKRPNIEYCMGVECSRPESKISECDACKACKLHKMGAQSSNTCEKVVAEPMPGCQHIVEVACNCAIEQRALEGRRHMLETVQATVQTSNLSLILDTTGTGGPLLVRVTTRQ